MHLYLRLAFLLLALSIALPHLALASDHKAVTIDPSSKLALRVLTRPGATLYQDDKGQTPIKSNLPTFSSYFVYTRPAGEMRTVGEGFYEVGSDDKGNVVGWLKADDVFEWKQTICLTYAHPEGRKPVLFFEDDEYLADLIKKPSEARQKTVSGLYSLIQAAAANPKSLPEDFPILSIEPNQSIDLTKNFTMLPILDHKAVDIEEREARLLEVVAISATEKERKPTTIKDPEHLKQAIQPRSKPGQLQGMRFDVVWVIDTTKSMGPFIDKTRDVVKTISKQIAANPELKDKVNFGVWGYRDSSTPDLEYVTNNFTPKLLPVDEFLTAMGNVQETKVDSGSFDEDVFSGVNDAINKTAWRKNAARIIILVGDAPGHTAGNKFNISGMDPETLRTMASEHKIYSFALHLNNMNSKAKKHNRAAAKQFKELTKNPGTPAPLYWKIPSNNLDLFEKCSNDIASAVVEFAVNTLKLDLTTFDPDPEPVEPKVEPKGEDLQANPTSADIRQALRAASVTWLGGQNKVDVPRDIEAYVVDKDLLNPARQSLQVRVLLTKAQLDTLATVLKEVVEAGATNQVSGEDFFTSLQAASAVAARNPEKLAQAANLGSSGLIPGFLHGLPYKSRLMDMNNEFWASWSPDEQDAFLNNLEAKIKSYQQFHNDSELWIALNEGDDPADYVAPVPLELMP